MQGRLQALEETCQQLQNALRGESSNASRGSGIDGRYGWVVIWAVVLMDQVDSGDCIIPLWW